MSKKNLLQKIYNIEKGNKGAQCWWEDSEQKKNVLQKINNIEKGNKGAQCWWEDNEPKQIIKKNL